MNSNLRSLLTVVIFTVVLLGVGGVAAMADTATWYSVTFTGADIWTYSADAAGAGPAGSWRPGATALSTTTPPAPQTELALGSCRPRHTGSTEVLPQRWQT